MVLTSDDGKLIYANKSYCEVVGSTLEEVVENGWHSVISPGDLQRTVALWLKGVEAKTEQFEGWSKYTKAGWLFWRAQRLADDSYAVAVFHPDCAFFTATTAKRCLLPPCGPPPDVAQK